MLPPVAITRNAPSAIVSELKSGIGLEVDHRFRGYAATLFGLPGGIVRSALPEAGGTFGVDSYVKARGYFQKNFGNEFQGVDLTNENIPTIEEYGQWVSRQLFAFYRDNFSEPGTEFDSSGAILQIYKADLPLLQALGVRFIVTDGKLDAAEAVMREEQRGTSGASAFLYELPHPNLGNYSPIRLQWVDTYAEAQRAIQAQKHSLDVSAVMLGDPWEPASFLLPAASSTVLTIKDGYRIHATSAGTSMIILPVQYSHCWRLNPSAATIVRANVIQTGIVFSGDLEAEMTYEYGLLATDCRRQDARDLEIYAIR